MADGHRWPPPRASLPACMSASAAGESLEQMRLGSPERVISARRLATHQQSQTLHYDTPTRESPSSTFGVTRHAHPLATTIGQTNDNGGIEAWTEALSRRGTVSQAAWLFVLSSADRRTRCVFRPRQRRTESASRPTPTDREDATYTRDYQV